MWRSLVKLKWLNCIQVFGIVSAAYNGLPLWPLSKGHRSVVTHLKNSVVVVLPFHTRIEWLSSEISTSHLKYRRFFLPTNV